MNSSGTGQSNFSDPLVIEARKAKDATLKASA